MNTIDFEKEIVKEYRRRQESLGEFGIPALAAFIFLVIESWGDVPEIALTAFIVVIALIIFAVRDHRNEPLLFIMGVVTGLIVEVGLRQLGYQQVWAHASLLGVPYWLPVVWGIGFVLITRLGIKVRGIRAH
jgi:hypothetical protein